MAALRALARRERGLALEPERRVAPLLDAYMEGAPAAPPLPEQRDESGEALPVRRGFLRPDLIAEPHRTLGHFLGGALRVPRSARERVLASLRWPGGAVAMPYGFFLGPSYNKVTNLGLEMLAKREFGLTAGGQTAGSTPAAAVALAADSTNRVGAALETLTAPSSPNRNQVFDSTATLDVSTATQPFVDGKSTFDQSIVSFIIRSLMVTNRNISETNSVTALIVYAVLSSFTVDLTAVPTWQWAPTYRSTFQSAT